MRCYYSTDVRNGSDIVVVCKRWYLPVLIILMLAQPVSFSILPSIPVFASGCDNCQTVVNRIQDPADADAFWAKVNALLDSVKKAKETGQPFQFTETFSQDEINAAIALHLAKYHDQVVAPKEAEVYLRKDGPYGMADLDVMGMSVTVTAVPDIQLEGGMPVVRLKSVEIKGVPGFLDDVILKIINNRIDSEYQRIIQSHKYDGLQVSDIQFGDGQVTITGIAQ